MVEDVPIHKRHEVGTLAVEDFGEQGRANALVEGRERVQQIGYRGIAVDELGSWWDRSEPCLQVHPALCERSEFRLVQTHV